MQSSYDVIIIGSGIVGLSVAYQIGNSLPDKRILVLDKESDVALHQTGHNSGVIHSGIYYKPGSLKATNCINGYYLLINFCEQNNVPYDICGKIIVATQKSQLNAIDTIYERGTQNGLKGIEVLNEHQIKEREPYCKGVKGLWVPQTGIVTYKDVCLKLKDILMQRGVGFYFNQKVNSISPQNTDKHILVKSQTDEFRGGFVINCAGLYSDKITNLTQEDTDFKIIPFRGEYYKLKKEKEYLVNNLIYPVPDPAFPFLGVHFTRMMKGGVEAGPNAVLAYMREGYKKTDINFKELLEILLFRGFQKVALKYWKTGLDELVRSYSKEAFTKALQELIPDIQVDDLEEGGSGVRAQACDSKGNLLDDFLILEQPNIINVGNAPSPAATSGLSIGQTIATLYQKQL